VLADSLLAIFAISGLAQTAVVASIWLYLSIF